MNILGIVGSIRKESIHQQIFNEYREISNDQFNLHEGVIKGIPMYDGDTKDEPLVLNLAEQIRAADGIIFFTPEYNYSIPGVLKNSLDWLSRCTPQPLAGKPATIIGASPGNIGTARMQYHLRQVGVFLDLHFMNKPEVMIGQISSKMENLKITDTSTIQFLQRHALSFSTFVDQSKSKID